MLRQLPLQVGSRHLHHCHYHQFLASLGRPQRQEVGFQDFLLGLLHTTMELSMDMRRIVTWLLCIYEHAVGVKRPPYLISGVNLIVVARIAPLLQAC